MKFETTFAEMGYIFGLIAKAEEKSAKYLSACEDYEKAAKEYCDSNYLLSKGEEMAQAYEISQKAEKAVKRSFNAIIEAFGCKFSSSWEDSLLIEAAKNTYKSSRFLYLAKIEALRLSKYLKY